MVIDRLIFSELGGFDERLRRLEDWDWLLRFSESYDVTFVAEPLADVYLTTRKPLPKGNTADPVRDYLVAQGRFAHLIDEDIDYIQSMVDTMWNEWEIPGVAPFKGGLELVKA